MFIDPKERIKVSTPITHFFRTWLNYINQVRKSVENAL